MDINLKFYLWLLQVWNIQCTLYDYNDMERYHNPVLFSTTISPWVAEGYRIGDTRMTPDFRLVQPMLEPYDTYYIETHRPYRVSPHNMITYYFPTIDTASAYGCYCTTVYKRFRLLAGCATITSRHILTTATSTELILRKFRKRRHLENILGFWYDVHTLTYNTSMYGTPSRIHYHPLYAYPKNVNRSHPFPVMYDLAVWAATIRHHPWAQICSRAAPHPWDATSPYPYWPSQYNMLGFQFMLAYSRRPQPWYKYMLRVMYNEASIPCPKTEWGWFICLRTGSYAPLGIDNGCPLHRRTYNHRRYDGLAGLNAISMRLRSVDQFSYFTEVTNYRVLDWVYDTYTSRLQYVWLDYRFYDTKWKSPQPKPGAKISYYQPLGINYYSSVHCCLPARFRPGYQ